MELFLTSLVSQILLQRYSHMCHCHEKLVGYDVVTKLDEESRRESLESRAVKVLKSCIHRPTILEVLDYHGQLQTGGQFIIRNCVRGLYNTFAKRYASYFQRELLVMDDGGTIALDWGYTMSHQTTYLDKNRPIVVLLHGLLGDSQSEYIYHFIPRLLNAGYRPVVMVARGCGGLALTSPSTFAGRISWDLYEAIRHLHRNNDPCQIYGIGYSLGAAAILHFMAHTGEFSGLEGAVAVCPPWDVVNTSFNSSLLSKLWLFLLAIPLKVYMLSHHITLTRLAPQIFSGIDLWKLIVSKTIHEIDAVCYKTFQRVKISHNGHKVTATTTKFDDLEEYYRDISSIHYIHRITVPTLVLSSTDDPICPISDSPGELNDVEVGDSVVTVRNIIIVIEMHQRTNLPILAGEGPIRRPFGLSRRLALDKSVVR